MTFPDDLIAGVYFLLIPVVIVLALRVIRAFWVSEFGDVEDMDYVAITVIAMASGFLWPAVVTGFVFWKIAFPPKPTEDETE